MVAALALACAVLASCGFGQDQVTGRLGETLSAGDYQLTLSGLENPAERPDRFTNPTAGNRFVKVDATVANGGQQHLPVAAAHFTLKATSPDGRETVDVAAKPGIPTDRGLRMTSISPGQRLETVLYFEMPANLNPSRVVFAPAVVGWRTRIEVVLQ
jgi:hypothetical protein